MSNTPGTMNSIGWAVKSLWNGEKVRRSGWNNTGMFLFLVPGSQLAVNRAPLLGIYPEGTIIDYQPHVDMRTAQGTVVPWFCSQTDLLATDWELAIEEASMCRLRASEYRQLGFSGYANELLRNAKGAEAWLVKAGKAYPKRCDNLGKIVSRQPLPQDDK